MPEILLVEAGSYRVGALGFALDQPGVYRFYSLGGETVQRLVRSPDPEELLRHVGWLWNYGSADEGEPAGDDFLALRRAPRFLGCSRLAFLAAQLLNEAGLPARVAGLVTTETRNGHDDGHTLTEVMLPDAGWIAYDPGFQGFPTVDGRRASIIEWVDAVRGGAAVGWLPLPGNPPLAPFRHSGLDYGPWVAERALSVEALKLWYRRLAGTALLWKHDRFFACADQVAPDALPSMAVAYNLSGRQQFLDLFYSSANRALSVSTESPPMKKAPDFLDVLADLIQELLWLVCGAVLALAARWRAKPIDVGLGPEPLINNVYHKKALIQAGFTAETFVSTTYFITRNFDHIIPSGRGTLGTFVTRLRLFWHTVSRYKIIYIYFNGGPFSYTQLVWRAEPLLLRLARVRVVAMPYGGDVQDFTRSRNLLFKHAMTIDYPGHALRRARVAAQIDLWTRNADHILSGCEWVDYMYHWDTLQIAHFSIDTEALAAHAAAVATDGSREVPAGERSLRVLHAPNHRAVKGTAAFVRAVEELAAEGVPIELEMVEFASNDEVLEAIARSDVVLDQLIVGWYAMFAIEAMAMGKPVVCFLRPDLVELYTGAGLVDPGEIPIVNAHLLSIKEVLRSLAATDRADLAALGQRCQAYVRRHHSLATIGAVFSRINSELGVRPG